MKIFATILLCLSLSVGFAQKCKYDVEKTDAFSGKKTLGTTAKLPMGMLVGFNLADDKYWIGLFFEFFGEKNEKIAMGDSMLIKLSTGEILTFYTNDAAAPTSYVAGYGQSANVKSYYKPNYNTDTATLQKLSTTPATDLKLFMGASNESVKIDEKYREKLMNAAACILK